MGPRRIVLRGARTRPSDHRADTIPGPVWTLNRGTHATGARRCRDRCHLAVTAHRHRAGLTATTPIGDAPRCDARPSPGPPSTPDAGRPFEAEARGGPGTPAGGARSPGAPAPRPTSPGPVHRLDRSRVNPRHLPGRSGRLRGRPASTTTPGPPLVRRSARPG